MTKKARPLTKLGKPRPGRKRTPEQQRDDAFTAKIVDESVERMKAMRSAACELLDGRPVETVDIMVGDKRAIDMIAVGGKKLSELTSDELAAFEKILYVHYVSGRAALVPYLDHLPRFHRFVGRSHAFGVLYRERHRLLLVDVLAGFEGVHEMLAMQVLRRGDQHRVQVFFFEHQAVIDERLDRGRYQLGFLALLGVDIAHGRKLGVRAVERVPHDVLAARAVADNSKTDALIRAPHRLRQRRQASDTAGKLSEESAPRIHCFLKYLLYQELLKLPIRRHINVHRHRVLFKMRPIGEMGHAAP